MQSKVQFSIITVCFNSAATIGASIRSLQNQTFQDFEHIIVDGASTDNTADIVAQLADDRVHLYSEPDDGIYDAMNKGVKLARGEFVYFLNSDDRLYDNNVLETIYRAAQSSPTSDIIYGDVRGETEEGTIDIPQPPLLDKRVLAFTTVCHQAAFFRRELFETIGLMRTDYKIVSDWEWLYRAVMVQKRSYLHLPQLVATIGLEGVSQTDDFSSEKYTALREHLSYSEVLLYRRLPRYFRKWKWPIKRELMRVWRVIRAVGRFLRSVGGALARSLESLTWKPPGD